MEFTRSDSRTPIDFRRLLEPFAQARAEIIVVGGVASVLWGAPIQTLDLDLLYSKDSANLELIATILSDLDAIYRDPAGRRIHPTVARLASQKINLLQTRFGALDMLAEIGDGLGYAELSSRTTTIKIDDHDVRLLDLGAIIESKEHADRDKDRLVLPLLRQTLSELEG